MNTEPVREMKGTRVDWTRYAEVYDLMVSCNPAYGELRATIEEAIRALDLPPDSALADIGAGTGEYSIALARSRPDCSVTHVEPNPVMVGCAQLKQSEDTLTNLHFQSQRVHENLFDTESLDLCLCVHALYTMPDPNEVLRWMHSWLKPGSFLVVCDLGRLSDVSDWRRFVTEYLVKEFGWLRAVRTLWRIRQVVSQNKQIARQQRNGTYWTHTHEQFLHSLQTAGFEVVSSQVCYRGYSDLAVARKA